MAIMAAHEHIQAPIVIAFTFEWEKPMEIENENEKHEMHISDGFSCGFVTNIIFYVDGDSRDNIDYYASMLSFHKRIQHWNARFWWVITNEIQSASSENVFRLNVLVSL